MTTPITAREIFLAYTGVHNTPDGKPQEYVTIEDYNRMATQADRNSDKVQELKVVVDELKAILQRWATHQYYLNDACDSDGHWRSGKLTQLIADTQSAIGGTNEPINQ